MTVDLFEIYRRAVMHKTNPSRKEAFGRFISYLKVNPDALEALAQDYFDRKAVTHWQEKADTGVTFGRVAYKHDKERAERQTATALATMKEAIRNTVLMDMTMPNGKLLRFATGAECAKAGGFYKSIAAAIKPAEVVDKHLTESDLQNIRARHFQVNDEAA